MRNNLYIDFLISHYQKYEWVPDPTPIMGGLVVQYTWYVYSGKTLCSKEKIFIFYSMLPGICMEIRMWNICNCLITHIIMYQIYLLKIETRTDPWEQQNEIEDEVLESQLYTN